MENEKKELAIFEVGNLTCALPTNDIQEINKHLDITEVRNANPYIRGIVNMRGNIITVIDLRVKFGFKFQEYHKDMRIIVVHFLNESIGLLVDKIIDVVIANPSEFEDPPTNIEGIAGKHFSRIYKMENNLAAVLKLEEILKTNS